MIYLDNAATTPIDPVVLEAMMPYLTTEYGNPGGLYGLGRSANAAVQTAREQVAHFLRASPEQVIFTSGGSEANNLVFHGIKDCLKRRGKTHILVSAIEHDSVLKAAQILEEEGFTVELIPPLLGVATIAVEDIRPMLRTETGLVSVMYANNETGDISNVVDIGRECHSAGILFYTDCVQAAGCLELDVDKFSCDFLSISSHKIHGPKGVGALYVRDKSLLRPLIYGGSSQEFGLRGGTENVAGIVGFGKACELAQEHIHDKADVGYAFRNVIGEAIRSRRIKGIHVNGAPHEKRIWKTLSVSVDDVDAQTLLLLLDANGVCASAGSACCSHDNIPSHVLTAIGLTDKQARETLRFSFSRMTSRKEAMQAAEIFVRCVETARDIT